MFFNDLWPLNSVNVLFFFFLLAFEGNVTKSWPRSLLAQVLGSRRISKPIKQIQRRTECLQ